MIEYQMTVQAMQYTGDDVDPILDFGNHEGVFIDDEARLHIRNRGIVFDILPGDWIIKDPHGYFSTMRDEQFKSMFKVAK